MKLKSSALASFFFVAVLSIAGCSPANEAARSPGAPADRPDAPASSASEVASGTHEAASSLIDPSGNIVLFIDNGSIPGDAVDIRIEIDGETLFDGIVPAARDSQISPAPTQPYLVLRLSRGRHVLKAQSRNGAASLQKTFDVADRLWIGLAYTYNTSRYGTPSPREFNIVVSEKEMGRV